ncbi:uncharacterized protein LOC141643967 [Silene latifolia]|uniref:uncharacterized protein LOC141643967 n=1 Tax=Silene latifolia TaxID=37657 RepID=UPI003D77DB62
MELNLISLGVVYTLTFDVLNPSLGLGDTGINFLRSLYLKAINVSGDILEYLLSECRLLERLHVEGSDALVRWKVFDSSCKLKKLTIFCCRKLEELEIDAVNLLYLRFRTPSPYTNVVFKNMPVLAEAMFGGSGLSTSTPIFRQLSHITTQISKLTLDFFGLSIPIRVLPTFCKLEQFTLMVQDEMKFDIVVINQFLKAFPMLREFTLEITWPSDELEREGNGLEQVNPSIQDFVAVNKYT